MYGTYLSIEIVLICLAIIIFVGSVLYVFIDSKVINNTQEGAAWYQKNL